MGSLHQELFERARSLQSEIEQFAVHVRETRVGTTTQLQSRLNSLSSDVQVDARALERKIKQVRQADDPGVPDVNGLSGANLPFYEAIWEMVKRSRDIVDIRCKICITPTCKPALAPGNRIMPSLGTQSSSKLRHITVDVITDGGLAWYKVSTMTNRKLIYDLAKEAVYCGDSDDDDDDPLDDENADLDIPLLKIAKDLTQAAANHRIRTKQPQTYIILPRVSEGENIQVDKLLQHCRRTGATILCGAALPPVPNFSMGLMEIMFPSPSSSFTKVLNIDTSVLVALASDFSHTAVPRQGWYNRHHVAHWEQEKKEHFLPTHLYPILGNHELVCVIEAAETLRHIVSTMGTPAEKARARAILGEDGLGTVQQELITALQGLSIYDVPSTLRLPIRVVEQTGNNCQQRLNDATKRVLAGQLNPGRSVFTYGWASGTTSITCNAAAVKQMATELEGEPQLDDAVWPSIWAFPTSRPLVGTPKPEGIVVRAKKHIGDCQTNGCTCGLDKFYTDKDLKEDLE
ncbi:LET1 protein [Apiospora arundinis]